MTNQPKVCANNVGGQNDFYIAETKDVSVLPDPVDLEITTAITFQEGKAFAYGKFSDRAESTFLEIPNNSPAGTLYNVSVKGQFEGDSSAAKKWLTELSFLKLILLVNDNQNRKRLCGTLENPMRFRFTLNLGASLPTRQVYDVEFYGSFTESVPFYLTTFSVQEVEAPPTESSDIESILVQLGLIQAKNTEQDGRLTDLEDNDILHSSQIDALQEQIDVHTTEIGDLNTDITNVNADIAEVNATITDSIKQCTITNTSFTAGRKVVVDYPYDEEPNLTLLCEGFPKRKWYLIFTSNDVTVFDFLGLTDFVEGGKYTIYIVKGYSEDLMIRLDSSLFSDIAIKDLDNKGVTLTQFVFSGPTASRFAIELTVRQGSGIVEYLSQEIGWFTKDIKAEFDNSIAVINNTLTEKADLVAGKVPSSQLPSYVDDVLEFADLAAFPGTGETGKIYVALDTNRAYRWGGSSYIEIVASPGSTDALAEGTTNLYFTVARVLSSVLGSLSGLVVNTAISAADTVKDALGKLQGQIDAINTANTGDETAARIGALINGSAAATPNDSDLIATADGSVLKKLSLANFKTFLQNFFDTKYKGKIEIQDYLVNRSPNVSRIITNASSLGSATRGAALGNSIVQGSNSTSAAAAWAQQLGGELFVYTGVDSGNNWSPGNFGEGGQNLLNIAAYLADDGDTNFPQVTRGRIYSLYNYFFLMPLRNSTTTLTLTQYAIVLRAIIRQIKAKNMDCIIVTENPQINQTTGAILDTQSNFGDWKDIAEKLAAEEGASFFDYHKYCVDRAVNQGFDLRTIVDDGTHPNDAGHDEIANFIFKGLIKPAICSPFIPTELANGGYSVLVSRYNAMSGSTSTISGLGTSTTPRRLQLNEGTTQAYVNSGTLGFWSPIPAVGQIMVYLGGSGNTTTVSHRYSGTTVGATGLTLENSVVRSNYSLALWQKTTASIGSVVNAGYSISASGNAQVQGCIFIGSSLYDYQPKVVNGSESGTWSDVTMTAQAAQGAGGGAGRQSVTIGDSITIRWYGHSLHCELVIGPNFGKIDQVTDGGSTTTIECYTAAAANTRPRQLERNLAEGWHTTVLTVATKNASSSANTIRIGQFRSFTDIAFSSNRIVYKNAGDVFRVPQSWKNFNIQRVISGAPIIDEVIEGASSITVGGTGVAAIKLER